MTNLLDSVRNRLVLLFFAITTAAVGFVYLYVVPQLSSSLTAQRLERLELAGVEQNERLARALRRGADRSELTALLRRIAGDLDARVTVLGVRSGAPAFVVADSEGESDAVLEDYPVAARAVSSGSNRSGIESRRGARTGETALPIARAGGEAPLWVAVLSTPLAEVEDNVALIRRQIIIAGAIALAAALLAAWLAAGYHARRLRRLELAAEQVAGGNFNVPIRVDSADEVGQVAAALDTMQRRLARLDTARREFIANASHELRTPIGALGGFVELLGDEEEPDEASRREFVATMRDQVERLTKLTADLLDLSKLDADALELSSDQIDLVGLASDAAGEFAAVAEQRRSEIRVGDAAGGKPLVQADLLRTMQIMRILIDNAVKHPPKGTTITITTDTAGDHCTIRVSDDGPAMPAEVRDRVFERFYTADAVSGSGLGLSIARELARLMGGDLVLEPTRSGTTFALSLPCAGGSAAA
jgi:signal transduction histidine kinase